MAKLARDISAYACRRKSQRKLPPGPPLRRSATILVHMAEVTRTLGLLHDVEATARGEAGPLVPMLLRLLHGQPRWSFGTVLYEGDETVAFHWTSWADLLEAALGHPKALRMCATAPPRVAAATHVKLVKAAAPEQPCPG